MTMVNMMMIVMMIMSIATMRDEFDMIVISKRDKHDDERDVVDKQ